MSDQENKFPPLANALVALTGIVISLVLVELAFRVVSPMLKKKSK